MKQRITSIAKWATATYPGRLLSAFGSSQASNYASGLAFNAFVSMFPLILGLLSILGLATQAASTRTAVIQAILGFFPPDPSAHAELVNTFLAVQRNSGLFGIIGLVGLLWSGSSLFTSMAFSLGIVTDARQRGFLRQRAMALAMTILFVLALVTTVAVNSLIALPGVIKFAEPLAGLLVWFAFMLAVYRLVPNRTHRVTELWPGILIAGTAMEILTLVWPLYAGLSHNFNTYGKALALFFVLASWLYFLSEFILLGAVANRLHAGAPDARGLFGEGVAGRTPVAEASRTGGEVSRTGA